MKTLLWLILLFFRPAADGDADPDEPELDLSGGDPDPEPKGAAADPEPQGDPEPDPQAALRAELETERRARAEERERASRYERELAEVRAQSHRPATDPQLEEEERILRDPNSTDLQKWQIQANREIRAGRGAAQNALAQAQDINDRTAFQALATKNPPLFKRYEARVEEEYQKLRAKGQAAPREAILRFLIGNDALDGKLTRKAPAGKAADNPNINRGRLPGARSDTSGKNSMSEREKRRARLENVQI